MHHVPTHACSGHLPGYRTLRMSAAGLAHPANQSSEGSPFSFDMFSGAHPQGSIVEHIPCAKEHRHVEEHHANGLNLIHSLHLPPAAPRISA